MIPTMISSIVIRFLLVSICRICCVNHRTYCRTELVKSGSKFGAEASRKYQELGFRTGIRHTAAKKRAACKERVLHAKRWRCFAASLRCGATTPPVAVTQHKWVHFVVAGFRINWKCRRKCRHLQSVYLRRRWRFTCHTHGCHLAERR
jgi:hypothetical protein